jgi:hypothetical protein
LAGKGIKGSLAGFFQSCLLGATVNSKQVFIIADFRLRIVLKKMHFSLLNPQSAIRNLQSEQSAIENYASLDFKTA